MCCLLLSACSSVPDDPEAATTPALETGAAHAAASTRQQETWLCRGDGGSGWNCRTQHATAGDTARNITAANPTPAPAPVAAATTAPKRPSLWQLLQDAPPEAVIIQLVAASEPQTLDRYRAQRPALPYEQIELQRDGQHHTVLFLGPYSSRQQADEIVDALAPFPETPWIRPVAAILPFVQP